MNIDLHLHTSFGSACSYMDPDQLITRAKAIGLDGVCLTDHDHIWGEESLERLRRKHNFLIIGGSEVNTDYGEMLVFGLHRSVLNISSAHHLKKVVDESDGAIVLAHPFRLEPELVYSYFNNTAKPSPKSSAQLEDVGRRAVFKLVDAMEVYNGQSGIKEKEFTKTVAEHLHLGGTGGSDAHAVLGVGSCYTVFEKKIKDERDLIEQIKKGTFHGVDKRWSDN